jgi:Domain of unknown function (DUF4928)
MRGPHEELAKQLLKNWYGAFRGPEGQEPKRYVVCADLAVLEAARKSFPLARSDYIIQRNQVKTSRSLIQGILARNGETRVYAEEGGCTTGGTVLAAELLANLWNCSSELIAAPIEERQAAIDAPHG